LLLLFASHFYLKMSISPGGPIKMNRTEADKIFYLEAGMQCLEERSIERQAHGEGLHKGLPDETKTTRRYRVELKPHHKAHIRLEGKAG
jgi:hypothetical protein